MEKYGTQKISFVIFPVIQRNYKLKKEDWGHNESSSLFDANKHFTLQNI